MAMEHHGEESSPYFQRIRRETVSIAKVPDYYAKYVSDRRLFLELAIVFDLSMYEKYGRNKETLNDRATQVATLVNSVRIFALQRLPVQAKRLPGLLL
ncbi:hypothetical protein M514_03209, partial [Trichuris suis]